MKRLKKIDLHVHATKTAGSRAKMEKTCPFPAN